MKLRTGLVGCFLALAANANPTATVTWMPSQDKNVAGYYFYYGSSRNSLIDRIDVGTNCSATIICSNSVPRKLVCLVSAYSRMGDESEPSGAITVRIPDPSYLQLNPLPAFTIGQQQALVFTNSCTRNTNGAKLTYSLDPGAPPGMTVTTDDGVLRWIPEPSQTNASFTAVVRVTDGTASDAQCVKVSVH